jgi:four helix bundle protein
VVSIPANIAEGHGRATTGEYIQHLGIAYASLMEVETHLQIAERLGLIKTEQLTDALHATREIGRMTNVLLCRLRQRRHNRQP